MKKGLIISALVLILAGGVWVVQQRLAQTPSAPGVSQVTVSETPPAAARHSVIDYVPADTVFFFGSLEPIKMSDYTAMFKAQSLTIPDAEHAGADLDHSLSQMAASGQEPSQGMRMLFGLYAEYLSELRKPDGMVGIGIDVPFDSAFYMQGPLPVVRIRLKDEAAFDAFVARAAERFGAKGEGAEVDGLSYQRFALSAPGAKKPLGLVLAHHDGFAVVTLDVGDLAPTQTLAQALGKTLPAQSLATSAKLVRIAQANGFLPVALGFIDHAGLLRAVTRADDPLALFLDKLTDADAGRALAPYREPACQHDLESMAVLWPRTVFGYTRMDTKSSPMVLDTLMKVESTDASLMKTLMGLRGFVATYGDDGASRVALKIGFNMDELAPTLTEVWNRATKADFTCKPLQTAQAGLRKANPALLAALTGAIQGVEGVGLAIQDVKLAPGADGNPEIKQFDGLVSVSTKHPKLLWGLLGTFNPALAAVSLPEDGQAADLPLPQASQLPGGVKLGHYGSHLVVFSGDKAAAAARSLASQPLVGNGLYELRVDYGLFADLFSLIPDAALAAAVQAANPKAKAGAAAGEAKGAPQGSGGTGEPDTSAQGTKPGAPGPATPEGLAEMRKTFERLRGMSVDVKVDIVPDGITVGSRLEIRKGA